MKTCKYCDWQGTTPVAHLAECQFAPEDARDAAREMLVQSGKAKDKPSCCKLRRKILFRPIQVPEELCGIPDSEVLDILTFEQFQGIDMVCPRFCPWCGSPWVRTGMVV